MAVNIWGDRFEANIDFSKAIRDADTLDKQLARAAENVEFLGTRGRAHISAMANELSRAANEAGRLTGQMALANGRISLGNIGGQPIGALGMGQPLGMALYSEPTQAGGRRMMTPIAPPTIMKTPSSIWGALPWHSGLHMTNARGLPAPASPNWQMYQPLPSMYEPDWRYYQQRALPWHTGMEYDGTRPALPRPTRQPWEVFGMHQPPPSPTPPGWRPREPIGALPPPSAPPPSDPNWREYVDFNNVSARGAARPGVQYRSAWGATALGHAEDFTGHQRDLFNRGAKRMKFLHPHNLMATASSLYIAQSLGHLGSAIANATIGEAMNLEERQTLLINALTSPTIGISREQAGRYAETLVNANYMSGMDVTAPEMGMSKTELAEQFRQLAPIIRLTATTPDEFQAGLQKGALAKALLTARDPVQGTKGAMVALSELYAGGPDRFRSLSLRFELPRNRLKEIEQELGGPGAADPGRVVIQMLSEMGFGLDYLQTRTETLAGQIDRTGALMANFRVELFEESMFRVRDSLMRFNDAAEVFMASPASDVVMDRIEGWIAGLVGFISEPIIQDFAAQGLGMAGAIEPTTLASDIADIMQVEGGEFRNLRGEVIGAAEAFREAAETITSKRIEQLLRAPEYEPGTRIQQQTALWGLVGMAGGAAANRLLFDGALGRMSQTLIGGGTRAEVMGHLGGGARAAASTLMPVAATLAVANAFSTFREAAASADEWRRFAAENPELAAQAGLGPGMGYAFPMGLAQILYNASPIGGANMLGNLTGLYELPEGWQSPLQRQATTMTRGTLQDALAQQAALLTVNGSSDVQVRTALVGLLEERIQAGQAPDWLIEGGNRVFGELVTSAMAPIHTGQAVDIANEALLGTILTGAAKRGQQVVGNVEGRGTQVFATDPQAVIDTVGGIDSLLDRMDNETGGPEETRQVLLNMLDALLGIKENTGDLASEGLYRKLRPSDLTDVFSGVDHDQDSRLTFQSGTGYVPSTSAPSSDEMTSQGAFNVSGTPNPDLPTVFLSRIPSDTGNNYNTFFGGTITDDFHSDRGTHKHGGMDYVDSDGEIVSPWSGTVRYLTSQADYDAAKDWLPEEMLAGRKFDVYGNTAVLTDSTGEYVKSYSHLDGSTIENYRKKYEGKEISENTLFAIQGNSGLTRSSSYPGKDIIHGLIDGMDAGAAGTHVHTETTFGGYKINPLYDASWAEQQGAIQAAAATPGGGINFTVSGVTISVEAGTPEAQADEAARKILSDPMLFSDFSGALLEYMRLTGNDEDLVDGVASRKRRRGEIPVRSAP